MKFVFEVPDNPRTNNLTNHDYYKLIPYTYK